PSMNEFQIRALSGSAAKLVPTSTPIRHTFRACCARAASGHPAAPPTSARNIRRCTWPPVRAEECHKTTSSQQAPHRFTASQWVDAGEGSYGSFSPVPIDATTAGLPSLTDCLGRPCCYGERVPASGVTSPGLAGGLEGLYGNAMAPIFWELRYDPDHFRSRC